MLYNDKETKPPVSVVFKIGVPQSEERLQAEVADLRWEWPGQTKEVWKEQLQAGETS